MLGVNGYEWAECHPRTVRKHQPDEASHRNTRPPSSPASSSITPVANISGSLHTVRSE